MISSDCTLRSGLAGQYPCNKRLFHFHRIIRAELPAAVTEDALFRVDPEAPVFCLFHGMGRTVQVAGPAAGAFSLVYFRADCEMFAEVPGKEGRGCADPSAGGFEFHFHFF